MKTYLVTGGAGFIGSNFVLYMLKKYEDIRIINLDKLTYAGNLENLKSIQDDPRHIFVHGDICDNELVKSLFEKYEIDFLVKINGNLIPIEVKSGRRTNSKSLNAYINKYNPEYSIRLSMKNFGFENNIKSIPLYATFCIN